MLHNANHICCNVGETAQSVAQKSGVEEKVSHAGHPGLRRSRHTSVVWRIIPLREPTFKGFFGDFLCRYEFLAATPSRVDGSLCGQELSPGPMVVGQSDSHRWRAPLVVSSGHGTTSSLSSSSPVNRARNLSSLGFCTSGTKGTSRAGRRSPARRRRSSVPSGETSVLPVGVPLSFS